MDAAVVSCDELRRSIEGWTSRCHVVPTCLDVERYAAVARERHDACVIGWVGSAKSRYFVGPIEGALRAMTRQGCRVVVVAGDDPQLPPETGVEFVRWELALEPKVFGRLDIGVAPLPDNERSRMKAGFKVLQYMAAGLPVVTSPVGANRELVRHGWNGFHATTVEEWIEYLDRLARDVNLRVVLGRNGQETVRERFSPLVAANAWARIYGELLIGRGDVGETPRGDRPD
jgi:glycosyltransferase involved in cell wall biosynthesis